MLIVDYLLTCLPIALVCDKRVARRRRRSPVAGSLALSTVCPSHSLCRAVSLSRARATASPLTVVLSRSLLSRSVSPSRAHSPTRSKRSLSPRSSGLRSSAPSRPLSHGRLSLSSRKLVITPHVVTQCRARCRRRCRNTVLSSCFRGPLGHIGDFFFPRRIALAAQISDGDEMTFSTRRPRFAQMLYPTE